MCNDNTELLCLDCPHGESWHTGKKTECSANKCRCTEFDSGLTPSNDHIAAANKKDNDTELDEAFAYLEMYAGKESGSMTFYKIPRVQIERLREKVDTHTQAEVERARKDELNSLITEGLARTLEHENLPNGELTTIDVANSQYLLGRNDVKTVVKLVVYDRLAALNKGEDDE